MSLLPCRTQIAEPKQIQISAGWFLMGSDTGQDVEGPVHRVWVDSFAMAATQVTVEEYARFLEATGRMPPPYWGAPGGPEAGNRKASRGGSWRHHIKISRCSARSSIPPEFQYADYGFRLVRDVSH